MSVFRKPAAARKTGATVTVYPDGPLVLRGDFAVRDVDGQEYEGGRMVALCRCGRSAVKPWCDGSHRRGSLAGGSGDDQLATQTGRDD